VHLVIRLAEKTQGQRVLVVLLEEMLVDYTGTLILISHDRTFLNNVVGSTVVMEGDGIIEQYAGGSALHLS
jgi:ATPase subunit of ABC transporter with duplicated ATPase domains